MQKGKKTGILRNEKGLTLIELLAVIVIIGIISAIAVPSIGGLLNKTKTESHRANAQIIIDAARMKVAADGATGSQTIYVQQLVAEGYLDVMPEDPDNKGNTYVGTATTGSHVDVTKDSGTGKYSYAITLQGNKDGGTLTDYYTNTAESSL